MNCSSCLGVQIITPQLSALVMRIHCKGMLEVDLGGHSLINLFNNRLVIFSKVSSWKLETYFHKLQKKRISKFLLMPLQN